MSQQVGEERRVVPFAAPSGRARRRLIHEADGRGAVLLFTGVRYERAADGEVSTAGRSGPVGTPNPRSGN